MEASSRNKNPETKKSILIEDIRLTDQELADLEAIANPDHDTEEVRLARQLCESERKKRQQEIDIKLFEAMTDAELRKNMNFYFWEGDDPKEGERYQRELRRRERLGRNSTEN